MILGLQQGATQEEIHAAFQRIEELYHPDNDPSLDAEMQYREARLAYDALREAAGVPGLESPNSAAALKLKRGDIFGEFGKFDDASIAASTPLLSFKGKLVYYSILLAACLTLPLGILILSAQTYTLWFGWHAYRNPLEFTSIEGNFSVELPRTWRRPRQQPTSGNVYLRARHEYWRGIPGRWRSMRHLGTAYMVVTVDRLTPAMQELREEMIAQWETRREILFRGEELRLNDMLLIPDRDSLASIGLDFPVADVALTPSNTISFETMRIGNHLWKRVDTIVEHKNLGIIFRQTIDGSNLYTVVVATSGPIYEGIMHYIPALQDIMYSFLIGVRGASP